MRLLLGGLGFVLVASPCGCDLHANRDDDGDGAEAGESTGGGGDEGESGGEDDVVCENGQAPLCWPRGDDSVCFCAQSLLSVTSDIVFATDIEADGDLDVIVAEPTETLLLRSSAAGIMAAVAEELAGVQRCFALGDLDEDGVSDLIGSDGLHAYVLLSDGTMSPHEEQQFALDPADAHAPFALGDVDADGHVDLVSARYGPPEAHAEIVVWPGRGDGSFAEAVVNDAGEEWVNASLGIDVFDGDADGAADVVTWVGWLSRGIVGGGGQLDDGIWADFVPGRRVVQAFAGDPYILSFEEGGDYLPDYASVEVQRGTVEWARWTLPGDAGRNGGLGDIDGDGNVDVAMVVGDSSNDIVPEQRGLLLGWGTATGIETTLWEPSQPSTEDMVVHAVADLSGDGRADLLVREGGALVLYIRTS